MGRSARVVLPGEPRHVAQRGVRSVERLRRRTPDAGRAAACAPVQRAARGRDSLLRPTTFYGRTPVRYGVPAIVCWLAFVLLFGSIAVAVILRRELRPLSVRVLLLLIPGCVVSFCVCRPLDPVGEFPVAHNPVMFVGMVAGFVVAVLDEPAMGRTRTAIVRLLFWVSVTCLAIAALILFL